MAQKTITAFVSPRDNCIGILSDSREDVRILNPKGNVSSPIVIGGYLDRFPSSMLVSARSVDEIKERLGEEASFACCLDLSLLLFDPKTCDWARDEAVSELEMFFATPKYLHTTLDVLLSKPMPEAADFAAAQCSSALAEHVRVFVETIVSSQPTVKIIYNAWLRLSQLEMVTKAGRDKVFAQLSNYGVFRRLATRAQTIEALDVLKAEIILDTSIARQFPVMTRILRDFVEMLRKELPGDSTVRRSARRQIVPDVADSAQEIEWTIGAHSSIHDAFTATVSQIDQIGELYALERDVQARAILEQLLSQLSHSNSGPSLAVKSLCNVATKARIRGRRDVSNECLARALTYTDGIDSRLYMQIGNEFRDNENQDRALECYEHAHLLALQDQRTDLEKISLAKTRLLVDQGKYYEALDGYTSITDWYSKADLLPSVGALYRRMGKLQHARAMYLRSLDLDSTAHIPLAGLAEVWKQKGDHHRAIKEYNQILLNFTSLEPGSWKVYQQARSHIFCLLNQLGRAENVLAELLRFAPRDTGVHFQCGSLYTLQGNRKKAEYHFGKAFTDKAHDASVSNLHRLIVEHFGRGLARKDEIVQVSTAVRPEEDGLAGCFEAFQAISNQDFEYARHRLERTQHVDRFTSDFAKVLDYHAATCGALEYSPHPRLRRLAKHGERTLRATIHAIAKRDFESVREYEASLFLRVA